MPSAQTLEMPIGTSVAMFEMQHQLAALLPRVNCTDVLAGLRVPTTRGTPIDATRRAALEAQLATAKPRGIRIGDRDATIFTLEKNMFVLWPRDPMGGAPDGTVSTGVPRNLPSSDIETFVGGVRAQPGVCAPCEPPGPNQPDCDTTPPTGPRGGGGRIALAPQCTPQQCAQITPLYCPAGDGGTVTSDAGTGTCECASYCCSP